MKNLATAIFASVVTLASISCSKKNITGEGPLVTQSRNASGFNEIDLQMYGNVYYKNDPESKLEIVAQQNVLDILETYVSGTKLVIKFKSGYDYHSSEDIRIYVSGPQVNNFVLTTSGNIYALNRIDATSIYVRSEGSGSFSLLEARTNSIEAIAKGSGDITINSGDVFSEKLKTVGSGKINLMGVSARTVYAETSGSGYIKTKVSDHLDARIEGSGSIYYFGFPSLSSHVSGSGRLIRL